MRGHNLYLPIPYAHHCKVTYSTDVPVDPGAHHGEALYYQINYRTYVPDTQVESFSMNGLAKAKPAIDAVNDRLQERKAENANGWQPKNWQGTLDAGETKQLFEVEGPAAICRLQLKIHAKDMSQALRSTVLVMECDGERTVWAPLGDFFGTS